MSSIKSFEDFINEEEAKVIGLNQPFGLLRKVQRTYNTAKVAFGYTGERGLGVFARTEIHAGEVIEICPLILLNKDAMSIDPLNDYLFTYDRDNEIYALALGYGSLYNHSDEPNADWYLDTEKQQIRFCAKVNLLPGQEITINHGSS